MYDIEKFEEIIKVSESILSLYNRLACIEMLEGIKSENYKKYLEYLYIALDVEAKLYYDFNLTNKDCNELYYSLNIENIQDDFNVVLNSKNDKTLIENRIMSRLYRYGNTDSRILEICEFKYFNEYEFENALEGCTVMENSNLSNFIVLLNREITNKNPKEISEKLISLKYKFIFLNQKLEYDLFETSSINPSLFLYINPVFSSQFNLDCSINIINQIINKGQKQLYNGKLRLDLFLKTLYLRSIMFNSDKMVIKLLLKYFYENIVGYNRKFSDGSNILNVINTCFKEIEKDNILLNDEELFKNPIFVKK